MQFRTVESLVSVLDVPGRACWEVCDSSSDFQQPSDFNCSSIVSWSSWVANCSSYVITVGGYPQPVPAGIAVPSWAYYDFTDTGVFNAGIGASRRTRLLSSHDLSFLCYYSATANW